MNILIDIGHPAHVHLFRNFISYLNENGHHVTVTSRDKDVAGELLDHYGIDHLPLTVMAQGLIPKFFELFRRDWLIMRLHRQKHFDIALGTSISITHLSFFARVKSYFIGESDDAAIPLQVWLSYPFATGIINPTCMKWKGWPAKRIFYKSYHELAYLHPDHFQPDVGILKKYNLEPRGYVIFRLNIHKAHHDVGARGLTPELLNRIRELLQPTVMITTRENETSHHIEPWDMHHVMAYAKMVIADSQTMTAEAAVLGVPAVRYNSFVGRIGYLDELEHRYGLTYGFRPGQEEALLAKIKHLLSNDQRRQEWQQKKERMLADKIDFNRWLIDWFERECGRK